MQDNALTNDHLEQLNAIGVALSAERNHIKLLEMILISAQNITNADGGTIYLVSDDQKTLKFEIMRCESFNVAYGGSAEKKIPFPPIPLFSESGTQNLTTVSANVVHRGVSINIPDVYQAEGFDFIGTRKFDEATGYRSKSFLTIPMKNHENEIIGVLQLINSIDQKTSSIMPFSPQAQRFAESLASQAAVALTNHSLIEGLKKLFEAFIELIASAIDEKSPYTGGHCKRVPELTLMLAQAAIDNQVGPLKDFNMTEKEFYELKIAGWLHDCGKVITPESVMDKPTKLSTIYDRIDLIKTRFTLYKQQLELDFLRKKFSAVACDIQVLEQTLLANIAQLDSDLAFLSKANYGSEFMTADDQQRVVAIGAITFITSDGQTHQLLTENEVYNLNITRGTLTKEERDIINNHIIVTVEMLEALPYPKDLRRVPEYAGGHHERMDGRGYPKGLTREQMSVPARIMGIADIFEALTSQDRPYKKAKTLTESLHILGKMKLDNHIDPDLFDIFMRDKIYLRYAEMFLHPSQIDEVDDTKIPGYTP